MKADRPSERPGTTTFGPVADKGHKVIYPPLDVIESVNHLRRSISKKIHAHDSRTSRTTHGKCDHERVHKDEDGERCLYCATWLRRNE